MKTKLTTLFVLLIVAVFASACGGSVSDAPQGEAVSVLTQEEATAMIDSAMQAFNTGDYAAWSRDWDDAMKAAIPDSAFQEYRSQVVAAYGQYLSLESVEMLPGLQKGNVRWVAIANFEKGKIKFTSVSPTMAA
jgi:Tfp pilus assembly protein PilF